MKSTLFTITTGIRGGNSNTKEQGEVTLRVYDTMRSVKGEITIDVFKGTGANYERREDELINIQFADGKIWSGNFYKLKTILLP